jgi:hypothetical protein
MAAAEAEAETDFSDALGRRTWLLPYQRRQPMTEIMG